MKFQLFSGMERKMSNKLKYADLDLNTRFVILTITGFSCKFT